MKLLLGVLLALVIAGTILCGVTRDRFLIAGIDRATISIHTVQYGTMPMRTHNRGWISRVGDDSRASVQVVQSFVQYLNVGQSALVKIAGIAGSFPARVRQIGNPSSNGQAEVELSFAQPVPADVHGGDSADAFFDYGKIENTLYMERGAFSTENASAPVFRLDSNKTAIRVTVHFGVVASELIAIKSGLKEGDRVIVTDMSRYDNVDRIKLD